MAEPRDYHTFSNYHEFRTVHTETNFTIDFDKQLLRGHVILSLLSLTGVASQKIVLDSSYLDITDVKVDGETAKWSLAPRDEILGSALTIELSKGVAKDATVKVLVETATTKDCTALQWLTPEQTSNRKHPYMFSQCEAIHTRSIFPCQDTPDVKSTFTFNLTSPLQVLASGLPEDKATDQSSGPKTYVFRQDVPIPSYLFAIASGDIVSDTIGPRSYVWTGPDELKACKWEFDGDTEAFIQVLDKLVFPYAWGQYNVLVLPPSFPYGGMENPVYTFATPTLVSGDKQNVNVIAHELAHSWSGNLVSMGSWGHFWLNEGWTVYLERRILAALSGEPDRDFAAIIGWKALEDSVARFGEDHEFTKLIQDQKGKDPDDAFSSVPYEKGSTFLKYLEDLFGKDKWDEFIPHYFTKYKCKSLDSYEFKSTLLDFFKSKGVEQTTLDKIDWDTWFYSPGLPPKPNFDTSLVDVCYELASKWEKRAASGAGEFTPKAEDIAGWSGNQSVVFLERLQSIPKLLPPDDVKLLGETYGYDQSGNVELVTRYYTLGLKVGADFVFQPTSELLGKVGRMKFVLPLFRQLAAVNRPLAVETFEKNKVFYHPICRAGIEKGLAGGSTE